MFYRVVSARVWFSCRPPYWTYTCIPCVRMVKIEVGKPSSQLQVNIGLTDSVLISTKHRRYCIPWYSSALKRNLTSSLEIRGGRAWCGRCQPLLQIREYNNVPYMRRYYPTFHAFSSVVPAGTSRNQASVGVILRDVPVFDCSKSRLCDGKVTTGR